MTAVYTLQERPSWNAGDTNEFRYVRVHHRTPPGPTPDVEDLVLPIKIARLICSAPDRDKFVDIENCEFDSMMASPIVLYPLKREADVKELYRTVPELLFIWDEPMHNFHAYGSALDWAEGGDTGEILLAFRGPTLVGITGWFTGSDQSVHLRWHGMTQENRKRGYGIAAISILSERLIRLGYKRLYTTTYTEAARDWFMKIGFVPLSESSEEYKTAIKEAGGDLYYALALDL